MVFSSAESGGEVFPGYPAAVLRAPQRQPRLGADSLLRHVPRQERAQKNPVHRHEVVIVSLCCLCVAFPFSSPRFSFVFFLFSLIR